MSLQSQDPFHSPYVLSRTVSEWILSQSVWQRWTLICQICDTCLWLVHHGKEWIWLITGCHFHSLWQYEYTCTVHVCARRYKLTFYHIVCLTFCRRTKGCSLKVSDGMWASKCGQNAISHCFQHEALSWVQLSWLPSFINHKLSPIFSSCTEKSESISIICLYCGYDCELLFVYTKCMNGDKYMYSNFCPFHFVPIPIVKSWASAHSLVNTPPPLFSLP